MRLASYLGLTSLVILAACTSETIIHNTAPGSSDPGAEGGEGADACTPADPASVLDAKIYGFPSVDFAGTSLGFAYVGTDDLPTVQILAADADAPKTVRWSSNTVKYAHYGASYISTALGHNGDRFGFGWYTERAWPGTDGVWSTLFATVSASGKKTLATAGNDDHGRSGTDDMVQASSPSVMPFGEGFLLAWDDNRTKEPRVMNINLANWGGIYGRTYDANGEGDAEDFQIAQPTAKNTFAGVSDGTSALVLWTRGDGKFNESLYARSGSDFSPAEPPDPIATFEHHGGVATTAAARGADGSVLVVTTRTDVDQKPYVGSMMLGMTGTVKTEYADWKDADLAKVGVAATGGGFVVVAYEMKDEKTPAAVRVFWLDAKGKRVADARKEITVDAEAWTSAPAVSVSGARVDVAFASSLRSSEGSDERKANVQRATFCAAPAQ